MSEACNTVILHSVQLKRVPILKIRKVQSCCSFHTIVSEVSQCVIGNTYVRKFTITSDGGSEYHNLCSCLYLPKTTTFGTNTAMATPFELIMRWKTIKRLRTRGKAPTPAGSVWEKVNAGHLHTTQVDQMFKVCTPSLISQAQNNMPIDTTTHPNSNKWLKHHKALRSTEYTFHRSQTIPHNSISYQGYSVLYLDAYTFLLQ